MKRVLLFGGNGMAGHMIKAYLEKNNYEIYYTTRQRDTNGRNHIFFDAAHQEDIFQSIRAIEPDYIINCIGVLNEAAETYRANAVLVNSWFPHFLDEHAEEFGYKLIHISTDCIFSGRKGGYTENNNPDAESFYGKSKALGEINNERSVTIRTSIIGPEIREVVSACWIGF